MSRTKLHKDKEVVKVLREARRQGFDPKPTRSGHVRVMHRGRVVCVFPGTTSCSRAFANCLADLRRAGLIWPNPKGA
jgi:hypothetical protein